MISTTKNILDISYQNKFIFPSAMQDQTRLITISLPLKKAIAPGKANFLVSKLLNNNLL